MVQGTWLVHTAVQSCEERMRVLYFCWHLLSVWGLALVICVARHRDTQHTTTIETIGTHTQGYKGLSVVEHNTLEEVVSDEKIEPVKTVVSEDDLNSSMESVPTQVVSVGSDTGERMSPLEEFNTLHRHTDTVRKSIKLKESSIV